MQTASEETEGFDVMETVGKLHAEGCRWAMEHPIALGIRATYGIDRWGAFSVYGRHKGKLRRGPANCG